VAGIKVDPGWITGYARTVEQAGDDLTGSLDALRGTPLTSASFGELGRKIGTPTAYQAAAERLQQQLVRAADALQAAGASLRTVAREHSASDQDQAAAIRTAHQF
jgi:hypothetical protein